MNLVDIYFKMKKDVQYIEDELEKAIDTPVRELYLSSTHLLKAGGKRIRPVFVLLGGKWGNYDVKKLKHVAVPLELIHMASLVHDDVIDDADKRRGKDTVRMKWDNKVAMYAGDYIFARALAIASQLPIPQLHQILSNAIVEVCKGEIEQVKDLNNWDQNFRTYLRRIKRKTALLIAISCQLGAVASGATDDMIRKMYWYGYNVGMAFQITDDILDFTGTEKQLGKPAGSDLVHGNITLPALYSAHHGKARAQFQEWIAQNTFWDHTDEAVRMVREDEGIAFSQRLAERYIARAHAILADLPNNQAKTSLTGIANYIIDRKF
ncbi:polyprenyl synthetase family protein [Brevibacillus brevis]|uniref:polyprenyl synthetase family protein n=1 Tax=Brevibacillus brevis TaxID=1393 RepID=UPI000D0E672B|nr:polyprenyl synthetase family protein [Brevibacillus brevis]PSJ70755.1 heptaprenyl diphosphate synthase [Brevibacillus brevis]RED31100.1 heptaprenyl diphosphate synthase [Brevibacillus brevis]GEC89875.1 heptaprenyl diphosphate synthase component 2 [Brevibacillus brevis]VEF89686.1 Heptaprenyl diphosphate synthase component 2 [Brevibacillus brevis]